jgi:hypothetical protein
MVLRSAVWCYVVLCGVLCDVILALHKGVREPYPLVSCLIQDSRHHTGETRQMTAESREQRANSRHETGDSREQRAQRICESPTLWSAALSKSCPASTFDRHHTAPHSTTQQSWRFTNVLFIPSGKLLCLSPAPPLSWNGNPPNSSHRPNRPTVLLRDRSI